MNAHTGHPFSNLQPVLVVTFMRSGTHLTMDLLRKQFPIGGYKFPGEPLDALYLPLDTVVMPDEDAQAKVFSKLHRFKRPLFKSHYLSPDLQELEADYSPFRDWLLREGTLVYVIRHPAKVLASLYEFEKGYQKVDDTDSWALERARAWTRHVEQWTRSPVRSKVLRFEDILRGTEETLRSLESFLHMECAFREPLLPKRLHTKWRGRLLRMFAFTSESTEILTASKPQALGIYCGPETLGRINEITESVRNQFGYEEIL